jgi:prepilin-type N-terminal cleavage/methylation domain-containing protein
MTMKEQTGFTLIELLVAVTIVGILITVGLPSMRDMRLNQQVRTAASDFHLALLLTRSEAIKRNTNVDMARNTNWENGWDVEVSGGIPIIRTQDAFANITIACDVDDDNSADTCPSTVTFNRTGRPTSFVDFWIYVNGNAQVSPRCVRLSLSGVPKVNLDNDYDPTNGCG